MGIVIQQRALFSWDMKDFCSTSQEGRHPKYNEQRGWTAYICTFFKIHKVRHYLMRFKLNKHLFIVVYIQGIQKNCIVRGESVRDSARRILAHGRRPYILPTSGVLFWLTGFDIIRELPYPNLTFSRCLASLPKVIVLFKKKEIPRFCLKNIRSKWFSFGSNWLWMYGAPPCRDRLSFAIHWIIIVFFHTLFVYNSLVQAVKQFWSVSDIQDMDFTRFATIQNFINVHIIVKKNVYNLKMSLIIP